MTEHLSHGDIASRVEQIVKEHIGSEDALSPEVFLQEELDIDSLERVELGVKLEKTFGIALANEKIRNTVTLGDLIQLVIDAQQEKSSVNAS
jgi:acyl carrier protein